MRTLRCPPTPPLYRTLSISGSIGSMHAVPPPVAVGADYQMVTCDPCQLQGFIAGTALLHSDQREKEYEDNFLSLGNLEWTLQPP